MMVHELKTWPGPWQAARSGAKTYEIRQADRRYETGDILVLREWAPPADPTEAGDYTGSFSLYQVTHLTEGGAWGLPPTLVVMGIRMIPILAVVPLSPLGQLVGKLAAEGMAKLPPEEQAQVEVGANLLELEHEVLPCPGCPSCKPAGDGRPGMPQGRFRFN